jgi:ABC-2 type transport system permease protein
VADVLARLRPYGPLLRAQLRSQTEYRFSFAVDLLCTVVITAVEVVAVLVFFRSNPALGGFRLPEALLVVGLAGLGFALADLVVGNIERMPRYVRSGQFDTVLLRPLGTLPQLMVGDLALRRLGRVLQELVVLVVALWLVHPHWTPARLVLLLVTPVAGAVTFGSLFVLGATFTFWLIEAGEVANAFTYGGREFTNYPATVFGAWFRRLFGYGLGLAFVGYLPALALLDRADPLGLPGWLRWAAPLTAAAWAVAARYAWRFGIRHYRSTGS